MKLLAFIFIFSTQLAFASEDWTIDCKRVYQDVQIDKMIKKRKFADVGHYTMYFGSVTIYASPIVGAIIMPPAAAAMIYGNSDSKEEKVLDLLDDYTTRFNRLHRKVKKKVDPSVSAEEIIDVIEEGFLSGQFCPSEKKRYSYRQVKNYVYNQLKLKYFGQP
jgi:hypothetical protein